MTGSRKCFECGRKFMYVKGVMIFAIREYGGNPVRLHKACVERFDSQKPVTAAIRQEPGKVDNG